MQLFAHESLAQSFLQLCDEHADVISASPSEERHGRCIAILQQQAHALRAEIAWRRREAIIDRWDRSRIDQVLTNIVSNALVFGAGRPIDITLERASTGERARVTVRDRGIGIAADRLPFIFERFERATSARHCGGLGLGLFIARQIVETHGGTISVESELSRGSSFTVELPIHPATESLS